MSTATFLIYGLFDPRNGELRYVGKTETTGRRRLSTHKSVAWRLNEDGKGYKDNRHVSTWIRSLGRENSPEFQTLEVHGNHDDLVSAEMWSIEYYQSIGCNLTNHTAGGEGCIGYRHRPESIRKMKARVMGPSPMRGRKQSVEARLLVSRTKTGLTEEQQRSIAAEYLAGDSSYVVARRYGVSAIVVESMISIFGHKMRTQAETIRKIKNGEDIEKICGLYLSGLSANQIAGSFNVSARNIFSILERQGVERRPAGTPRKIES